MTDPRLVLLNFRKGKPNFRYRERRNYIPKNAVVYAENDLERENPIRLWDTWEWSDTLGYKYKFIKGQNEIWELNFLRPTNIGASENPKNGDIINLKSNNPEFKDVGIRVIYFNSIGKRPATGFLRVEKIN